jgi:hypothetical protein
MDPENMRQQETTAAGDPSDCGRVVMTAATVVLEPIFDVDMPAEQHGYRPNLSAHTAVRSVDRLINEGHTRIIEADLADYFGSIPHAELLKSVARRVSDRHILHLIKMWLEAPVEEDDGKGRKRRTTMAKDTGRWVPQGAPISPLLANLYMRRFVLGWKKRGPETRFGAKIVAYADDLLPRRRRAGDGRNPAAHDAAEADGQRRQNAYPTTATGPVCLSRLGLRSVLLCKDGASILMRPAIEEECPADQHSIEPLHTSSRHRATEPFVRSDHAPGELLQPWAGPQGVSGNKHKVANTGARRFSHEYLRNTLGLVWCAPHLSGQVAGCAKH